MKTYRGQLNVGTHSESEDVLLLDSEPLAELLEWTHLQRITVRYWVTDAPVDKEEAKEAFIGELLGRSDTEFGARYSEITGYLWTDEELNVGGHDLLAELKSYSGQWLILEVEAAPCEK